MMLFSLFASELNPLGDDLLPWLLLAFGGAMVAGNALALVKPPAESKDGEELAPPDPRRAWGMIIIGAIAAVWAMATLLT